MKDRSSLALDAGYLRAVIQAADMIDHENCTGEKRDMQELVSCLIHVAGRLALDLENDLYEENKPNRKVCADA